MTSRHLKSLTIQGYESHKASEIPLDPGVNVIVGMSDHGKSGIFRAFNWLRINRPLGDSNRSTWGGRTLVELEFADGVVVGRETDKEKLYYVNDDEFKAFKTDVPEEVVNALDLSEINVQSQFDPPFLLSASSGEVSKTLNRIANLTKIDTSNAKVKKAIQDNKEEIKTAEAKIADYAKQIQEFEFLPQMEKDVVAWEKLVNELTTVESEISTMEQLFDGIEKAQASLNEIDVFLQAEKPLTQALALVQEEKDLQGQIRPLEAVISFVEKKQKELEEINTFLEAEPDLLAALELVAELKAVQQEGQALQNLITEITVQETRLKSDEICLKQLEQDFKKSFPATCPLCGRN